MLLRRKCLLSLAAAALLAPSMPLSVAAQVNDPPGVWTQQFPLANPGRRLRPNLVYDAARNQVLLFGGALPDGGNETWTYNGATWTLQTPTQSPPSRVSAAMAYDAARAQVALFGGDGQTGLLNDTWIWDGVTWTQRSPTVSPSPRRGPMLAYDSNLTGLVLFGGQSSSGYLDETWLWTGSNWMQQSPPPPSPPPRAFGMMALHPDSQRLILFGGNQSFPSFSNDTWTWDGSRWTQRSVASPPDPRNNAAMAYDGTTHLIVLFGGYGPFSTYFGDTWTWNGTTWTNVNPPQGPTPRNNAAASDGSSNSAMVVYGGEYFFAYPTDTWTWYSTTASTPTVTSVDPPSGITGTLVTITGTGFSTSPGTTAISFGSSAASSVTCSTSSRCTALSPPARGTVHVRVTVGGFTSPVSPADQFLANPPAVTRVNPNAGSPLGGTDVTIIGSAFSTVPGETIIRFGPNAATNVSCPDSSHCTATSPAGSGTVHVQAIVGGVASDFTAEDEFFYIAPSIRRLSPAVGPSGSMVTISGQGFATAPGATAFRFGTVTAAGVSCVSAHECTATAPAGSGYAPVTARVGAAVSSASANRQFVYTGAAPLVWNQEAPLQSPPGRYGAALAYDATWNDAVLFGGGGETRILNDTWTWDGSTWTDRAPSISPPPLISPSLAYDEVRGGVVLFGGYLSADNYSDDTWIWDGANWNLQTTAMRPPGRVAGLLAFHRPTGKVVLFGGQGSGGVLNDTWTWDGARWSQQVTSNPPARSEAQWAYHSATGALVLFGGVRFAPTTYFSDTWTFDGVDWTQQSSPLSPPARRLGMMAEDPGSRSVVLFGGQTSPPTYFGDTWAWDGTTWIELTPSSSPAGRAWSAIAYDANTGKVLVYGGDPNQGRVRQETLTWYGGPVKPSVNAISPASGPSLGGTRVTVSGSGFNLTPGATAVLFGGIPASSVSCSRRNQCTAVSPPGQGTVDVTVRVGDGESDPSPLDLFTYNP